MKIGVISDTHGMLERTRAAAAVFRTQAVEAVLHCGDVGGLEVLQVFIGTPFWFVWGNTDRPEPRWHRALETWSIPWPESSPLHLDLAGKRIVLAHGHERVFRAVFHDPQADFLFHGHSHVRAHVRTSAGCTIVNPGAIHRTPQPTVAIVDLAAASVQHVNLRGRAVAVD